VTVAIGVVTATVVLAGVLTVAVATGVLTATVTAGVEIGSVGTETAGAGGVERVSVATVSALDAGTDVGPAAASPPDAGVDERIVLTLDPRIVSSGRCADSCAAAPRGVRTGTTAGGPELVGAGAAAAAGAITRAATTPVVASPAVITTAAVPFATAICGIPARFSQRHKPMPPAVRPSVWRSRLRPRCRSIVTALTDVPICSAVSP
jgi:hypothetical protein